MTVRFPILIAATLLGAGPGYAQTPDGAALFTARCATCHNDTDRRAPSVAALRQQTPEAILQALTTGAMRLQGSEISAPERGAVAAFLGGRPATAVATDMRRCAAPPAFDATKTAGWNGWSPAVTNTRFQPADRAGLTAAQTPRLTLKWAFGFPGATAVRALPVVAGGRVFIGSESGVVYALDAASGCTIWTYQAKGGVRSAISVHPGIGGGTAYFGDTTATIYAVSAATGTLTWSRQVEAHPIARITGAPTLFENRLYVPVSSLEEGQGRSDTYECCTFRGSVVALSAATGEQLWKTHTIPSEPRPLSKNPRGVTRWGPAGAAIWSSPTIDVKRRLVYAATGNMYTEPQQGTSDAVMAFDLNTGKVVWTAQVTPNDVFVVGCNAPGGVNCPDDVGPDFDFGNSPMLATLPSGRDLIVIGQKSGVGWALDPDNGGAVVWQYRAGTGGALGGMEWGSALDGERAYFPVSDVLDDKLEPNPSKDSGWLHAVEIETGKRVWSVPPPPFKCGSPSRSCNGALSAAITAMPGAVLVGSNDGGLRIHSTTDGSVIWEFDTNRSFDTVNGVEAKGGAINGAGPTVAGSMVFAGSGSGGGGGRAGNVLLAFGVD